MPRARDPPRVTALTPGTRATRSTRVATLTNILQPRPPTTGTILGRSIPDVLRRCARSGAGPVVLGRARKPRQARSRCGQTTRFLLQRAVRRNDTIVLIMGLVAPPLSLLHHLCTR